MKKVVSCLLVMGILCAGDIRAENVRFLEKADQSQRGGEPMTHKGAADPRFLSKQLAPQTRTEYRSPVDLTIFNALPLNNINISNVESCPIAISGNQILTVIPRNDSLIATQSTNGGLAWQGATTIVRGGSNCRQLSGIKTSTGRIIMTWQRGTGIQYSYSDNNGITWSTADSITSNAIDQYTELSQTQDGMLWCVYSRYVSSVNYYDIFYRTSTNNGTSWSTEKILLNTTYYEIYATVVSASATKLLMIYEDNSSGNYDILVRSSTNGGTSWSSSKPVANASVSDVRPKVVIQSNGTIWMIYQLLMSISYFYTYDIYSTKSTDLGETWTTPAQFTRYTGYDGFHNVTLVNDKPFVTFGSSRWMQWGYPYPSGNLNVSEEQQIWYGVVGVTLDPTPPPAVIGFYYTPLRNGVIDTISAFVTDETGITSVQCSYTVNGQGQPDVTMYDDGTHGDTFAQDKLYTVTVGPFKMGDQTAFWLKVKDVQNNTITPSFGIFNIDFAHDAGNLLLSLHMDSQLGDLGNPGYSAHWPKLNGQDYLYSGALWVGAMVNGVPRVSDYDPNGGDYDWLGLNDPRPILQSVYSNQDIDFYYDDMVIAPSPIGLRVRQRSYQWSAPTRDDFIIIKYTLYNTGLNGSLSQVFPALWLDPDITHQTVTNDDKIGFDQSRNMLYMYDGSNNPTGYIGIKLLGDIPYAYRGYQNGEDPTTDALRYSFITTAVIAFPTTAYDHRIMMTAQPLSINANQQKTVAFGIVMGNGLAELQANSDTMAAVYQASPISGIEGEKLTAIPERVELAQNYPNPFNGMTNYEFKMTNEDHITLTIVDILGREIATVVNHRMSAGTHRIQWDGGNLPSGIYFYVLEAGRYHEMKKMVLLR